jgi:hypothetical protein
MNNQHSHHYRPWQRQRQLQQNSLLVVVYTRRGLLGFLVWNSSTFQLLCFQREYRFNFDATSFQSLPGSLIFAKPSDGEIILRVCDAASASGDGSHLAYGLLAGGTL